MILNAVFACVVSGAVAIFMAAAAVPLSRVSIPLLPGFSRDKNRRTLDLTQGMRAGGLQFYAYFFFALAVVFGLYAAEIRSTVDLALTTGGGENLLPLASLFLIPSAALSSASSIGSHESAHGHLFVISVANGLSLFTTAQLGYNMKAWGILVIWWAATAVAMAYVAWQTMVFKNHWARIVAASTPLLVSVTMWLFIILGRTFDSIDMHSTYYFWASWTVIAAGLVAAAVNFLASAQPAELSGTFEELNRKRPKFN